VAFPERRRISSKSLIESEQRVADLSGRVAIITGGGWGIGRAISFAMSAAGAQVAVGDLNVERGEATAARIREQGGSAIFVSCDVSDPGQAQGLVNSTAEQLGRLDILINNAGIPGSNDPAHEVAIEDWDRVIAVNLRGPFLCAKYALPHLTASGHGAMVNIASTFGMIGAHGSPSYAASKGGVIALTRQLAVEYGPHGVRVNAISPGFIDTDMADRRSFMTPEQAASNLQLRESRAALQPLGRQADAAEIGSVAVFLASDEASFMTGSVVTVDGGCTATYNSGER
jgi:NAD(P)-dependent dehydrogenase (short-subunit alcohol dehydrogenase family)